MGENSNHVISRLKWDTTFDHKELAGELQGRLSYWSGFNMQKEMASVFDKLCPPEQTWRIQLLELDLGTIDLENLEFELSARLREQLNEKLTDLIFYSHNHGQHIEILNEKMSHILLIRHFLLHGLLPWNYQVADGSINQILSAQLQENPEDLIAMLKESGFKDKQVRQRMTWQFSEPNMIKIIKELEPNSGGQIVLFSNELAKVQVNEIIVQGTSTVDFKKNLWFWVLNYLLTERGTVFNRVQFMKSSIIQMAAHYNMQYDQLFELIEYAVEKINRSMGIQPDFLRTLRLLSHENSSRKNMTYTQTDDHNDYWSALTVLFRDQGLRRSAGKKAEFNDLVIALSRQDSAQFLTLIYSFGQAAGFWIPLINDSSDDTLKAIFTSIGGTHSLMQTESILFLSKLTGGVQPGAERNLLWFSGMRFLLDHKNTSFSQDEFIHELIVVWSKHKGLSEIALLDRLMGADIEISHTLRAVFMTEVSKMSGPVLKKHLQELITAGTKDQSILQNTLEMYTRFHPKAVKDAITTKKAQVAVPSGPLAHTLEKARSKISIAQLLEAEEQGLSDSLIRGLLSQQQVPAWFQAAQGQETSYLLKEIMIHYPEKFLAALKQELITEPLLIWLNQMISFAGLLELIGTLHQTRTAAMDILGHFHGALGNAALSGMPAGELQYILFKKVMLAWTSGNWKLISTERIWNELIWEVCGKRRVSSSAFITLMNERKHRFPLALKLSFESIPDQDQSSHMQPKKPDLKVSQNKQTAPSLQKQQLLERGILVKNAGIVLLSTYFPMLLERLGLMNDQKKFLSDQKRLDSVHYLQYLVTGQCQTEEAYLPLNKLLCGVPLSAPVREGIEISEVQQETIEGLIKAAIGHWPAIGKSTVGGFRGNWLVRDGLLTETEDRWELVVEKRAYDILISKIPFSFSVIRFPWMVKPLHVSWLY